MKKLIDWDLIYSGKETPWDMGRAEPLVINFIRRLKNKGKVVDLGCGTGNEAIALAKLGYKVVGYDISKLAIREAKKKAKNLRNVRFFTKNVLKIISNQNFDIVLDKACFHFLKSRERQLYVKKVYSLLRASGYFILLASSKKEKTQMAYTFSKKQIRKIFSQDFNILSIRIVKLKTHKEKRTPYLCVMTKK